MRTSIVALLAAALVACASSPDSNSTDTGAEDTGAVDTGATDAGANDAGADATGRDTGSVDAGGDDTGGADTTDDTGATDGGGDASEDAGTARVLDPWPSARETPACGTPTATGRLFAGPMDPGYDAELATYARRLERQFHALNTWGVSVNRMVQVDLDDTDARDAIAAFVLEDDGWDFEAATGLTPDEVIDRWSKTAGAYAGIGIAADALRYRTLRDEGADCDELEQARAFLRADLDALHLATEITGVPGVWARGFARTDQPGAVDEIVPLFDADGQPLPEEKNNGTWRADQSGTYPNYIWEDSCSRDMLIGWVFGMVTLYETIEHDPAFADDPAVQRLVDDAALLLASLRTVQDSGYDLEIRDADGRRTYHGIVHEFGVDRVYIPGATNGFNAMMATAMVASLVYITRDADAEAWLYDELLDERGLLMLARDNMLLLDVGVQSNYSMYNMVLQSGWLAQRYLRDPDARAVARAAVQDAIYDRGGERQPREQGQTFYDLVNVAAVTGESAFSGPSASLTDDDRVALDRGMATLRNWAPLPYWSFGGPTCDADEIEARSCVADDGTEIEVLGPVGRNGDVVAAQPIPIHLRPASNYWWRSNPYRIDGGGDGSTLFAGSDYRIAWWIGRSLTADEGAP